MITYSRELWNRLEDRGLTRITRGTALVLDEDNKWRRARAEQAHPLTSRPWKGKCGTTGKTLEWFEDQLKDCAAPVWAQRAAVSLCRSYGVAGLSDPAYIANVINREFEDVTIVETTSSEQHANARLIAAAPDMLEALEEAFRLIDGQRAADLASDKAMMRLAALDIMQAAINKATQEEVTA